MKFDAAFSPMIPGKHAKGSNMSTLSCGSAEGPTVCQTMVTEPFPITQRVTVTMIPARALMLQGDKARSSTMHDLGCVPAQIATLHIDMLMNRVPPAQCRLTWS